MHDKIRMLAQSKLNSIEALISQALMDKDSTYLRQNVLYSKGVNKNPP